ncbi:MAG: serine/threonine protein kinase [Bacillota bacterium]
MRDSKLYPGEMITGKWNQNSYQILTFLGGGGVGTVYKVLDTRSKQVYALKLSDDLQSITKEYEMLETFKGLEIIPKVKELDDCLIKSRQYYMIVMEYINGKNLKEHIENVNMGIKTLVELILIIGKTFQMLHKKKLIFGDLKPENLMIDHENEMVKIIDLGGVASMGTALKEYTPLYDRASWNIGRRNADKEYDLFSLCMLMTAILLKFRLSPGNMTVDKIGMKLKDVDIPAALSELIHKGLMQKSMTYDQFLSQLEKLHSKGIYRWDGKKSRQTENVINSLFLSSIVMFLSILFFYAGKSILW